MSEVMLTPEGDVLALIHLERRGKVVCIAEPHVLHATLTRPWALRRTTDWRSVNCEICKGTDAYREAQEMRSVRRVT